MNDRDYMKKLIQLIESAENVTETPEPVDPWKKLFEYNVQSTLKNYAPKMIAAGIYGVFSSMSSKGVFSETPTGSQVSPEGKLNDYGKIAHKLLQVEVHRKFAEHQQSGKVKQFIDSDSIAQVDRAVDAFKGGHDDIDLDQNHPFRSMSDYGDPNPDDKENAPWPGPDGETGGYPPGPQQVRRRGFSLDKGGEIEKHTYNATMQAKGGIPGTTGYLDLQPLGTFENAGLGRATPVHVWAGVGDDVLGSNSGQRNLVGYRSGGSNFEINPLFNEIMNDPAFRNKFATTFLLLLETFDPTNQKRYTLPLLRFFLQQEFHMKVLKGGGDNQPGLAATPGRVSTFPNIEDMRSTVYESILWFDQNKHRLPVERRDINRYEDINQFSYTIDDIRFQSDFVDKENPKVEKDKGTSDLIYTSEHADMYWVKDKEASCHIGQGTRWCTAATKSTNYFSEYNAKGPLLIINFKKPTTVATSPKVWRGLEDIDITNDLENNVQKVNRVQMNLLYGEGLGSLIQGEETSGVGFDAGEWGDRLTKLPYGTSIEGVSKYARGKNSTLGSDSYYKKFMYMANAKDVQVWPIISNPTLTKAGIDLSDEPMTLMWQDPKFQTALKQVGVDWNKEMQHPYHGEQFADEDDMRDALNDYEAMHDTYDEDNWEDEEEWGEDGLD